MKEGFSQDRTSSTNVCGYSQNQFQGIELDVQRDEGCAATKVCGDGYDSHGRRPWTLNESINVILGFRGPSASQKLRIAPDSPH